MNSKFTIAGVHLSGSNAKKTSAVIFEVSTNTVNLVSVYEKIGSIGTMFSDDRLVDVLSRAKDLDLVVIDCPLTTPPCVACQRPKCPGPVRCDDIGVAMMLAKSMRDGRRKRPINPQCHRVFDVLIGGEPTYSPNMSPLVNRAQTFKKRMFSVLPEVTMAETNVPLVMKTLARHYGAPFTMDGYKNFESGINARRSVLDMIKPRVNVTSSDRDSIVQSLETFEAFVAAMVGLWKIHGITTKPHFSEDLGWVENLDISKLEDTSR
jgi:hypothetical protein